MHLTGYDFLWIVIIENTAFEFISRTGGTDNRTQLVNIPDKLTNKSTGIKASNKTKINQDIQSGYKRKNTKDAVKQKAYINWRIIIKIFAPANYICHDY